MLNPHPSHQMLLTQRESTQQHIPSSQPRGVLSSVGLSVLRLGTVGSEEELQSHRTETASAVRESREQQDSKQASKSQSQTVCDGGFRDRACWKEKSTFFSEVRFRGFSVFWTSWKNIPKTVSDGTVDGLAYGGGYGCAAQGPPRLVSSCLDV